MPADAWELNREDLDIGQMLGNGHFGVVRKGLLNGNIEVAIKELRKGNKYILLLENI